MSVEDATMSDVTYELRVSGPIPEGVLPDLGDLSITLTGITTVLSGTANDQSALLGLLARLRALGLDVIEVHRMPDISDSTSNEVPN